MRWFALLSLMVVSQALAATAFQSKDDVGKWMASYYLRPDPEGVPDAIKYMSEEGMFRGEHSATSPGFGFLAACFRANPGRVSAWLDRMDTLNDDGLTVAFLGVRFSGLPDTQKHLEEVYKRHPDLKARYGGAGNAAPTTVFQIPLEKGPRVLDMLWGTFLATGEKAPVIRIISALPWANVKGDAMRMATGQAARGSLASNASQHKLVLQVCEEQEKTQSPEIAKALQQIIASVESNAAKQ